MLTAILKTIDNLVNIAKTSSFITLLLTGFGLIVIRNSTGIACRITLTNKVSYEINMSKNNIYRK